ncbi:MAG TPA: hypothetical protein PLY34_20605 [Ferruginibacter sp.]|nr:hypothetical protein [Ferruginibacter sp.]
MKQIILLLVAFCFNHSISNAQEKIQELSKKASKGFIAESDNSTGNYLITYKIGGDRKKNEIFYETYLFDKDLQFVKQEEIAEPKLTSESMPDKTKTRFGAYVGGCSSFDVLSMKLKLKSSTINTKWDYKKQRYVFDKTIKSEMIKAKNDHGKYYGYASYNNSDADALFVIAATEGKKDRNDFFILTVNSELEIIEKPVDISGSQSLVYTSQFENGDVVMIFAPKKNEADKSAYTYLLYTGNGELKNKVNFKSPSNNLLITNVREVFGSVYFCGTSTKSTDSYDEVFEDYTAEISNPCYKTAENYKDEKWLKKADDKMDNFHLLKFTGNQLVFATTTPVNDFKSKFKTAPADKGADPYKGKNFQVNNFFVTADEEYFVAGQIMSKVNLGLGNPVKSYEDIICFHFDKAGQFKTQYGTQKMNTEKKSEIFPVGQYFVPSKDGKSIYWTVLEVKGFKGYDGFLNAYYDVVSYYGRYFPRIAKIDLQTNSISNFTVLGKERFFVNHSTLPALNYKESSITFIGNDEDYKKLWLAKYVFE